MKLHSQQKKLAELPWHTPGTPGTWVNKRLWNDLLSGTFHRTKRWSTRRRSASVDYTFPKPSSFFVFVIFFGCTTEVGAEGAESKKKRDSIVSWGLVAMATVNWRHLESFEEKFESFSLRWDRPCYSLLLIGTTRVCMLNLEQLRRWRRIQLQVWIKFHVRRRWWGPVVW